MIIDNFAGGGGASTGIERAIGRAVDAAINHDAEAIAMHIANHPATKHYCKSIIAIDPLDVTNGAMVDLAWFSPDCKHHSKAKGGKPREKNIRDLAWIVVHWIERLQHGAKLLGRNPREAIRTILLENVEEFRQWGPLDENGFPIKERQGEEFKLFCARIRRLGGKVDFKELRACDYGAPTIRKRLYMIVQFMGDPIVWPAPTHGKPGTADVESGKLKPWRTAAECIDWSIPCPSIFERAKPLKDATHRRIAHGVMRYVVNAARPFIVPVTHSSDPQRVHSVDAPIRTITTANGGEFAVSTATMVQMGYGEREGQAPRALDVEAPLGTVVAGGGKHGLVVASLEKFSENSRGRPADEPLDTVMAGAARHGVIEAELVQAACLDRQFGTSRGASADAPMGAAMAGSAKTAVVTAFLHKYRQNSAGADVSDPAPTVTANSFIKRPGGAAPISVVSAHLEQANAGPNNGNLSGRAADAPVSTVTTTGSQQRLVQTTMVEADALPPEQMQRAVRVAAFLIKYYGNEVDGHGLGQPLGTVTTKDRFAIVTVTIDAVTYVIVDIGMRMLTRRELANAQGFPPGYVLDPIGPNGRPLSISSSIRMIGNSVCPDVSDQLVRSNRPDLCGSIEQREAAA